MKVTKEYFEKTYNEKWPINKYNECEIEKTKTNCIIITINKKQYALNGFAKMELKLHFLHDKKIIDKGISVGTLIAIGNSL